MLWRRFYCAPPPLDDSDAFSQICDDLCAALPDEVVNAT